MSSYQRKTIDGKINPKFVDLLDEDRAISGQKFVCVSFVSPENILNQKNMFLFKNFLKYFDFKNSMDKYNQFLNFISFKYNINYDKLSFDFKEFVDSEKEKISNGTTVEDEWKNFLDAKEDDLTNEFNSINDFQTNTRGLKVRGTYPTQQEAELRCVMLRESDPNHNVYVGPVGMWMPWEPEAYKTGRVEYLEEELNQLMHEKNKNEVFAKQDFDNRIKEAKQDAIQENIKLAKKTGNKLTQSITKDGELIGVQNTTNTIEQTFVDSGQISSSDIRKELFESTNVGTKSSKKTN
jgi:hypothetical protein